MTRRAMQYIRSPVSTLCIGQAASMGSLLLCAGVWLAALWQRLNAA